MSISESIDYALELSHRQLAGKLNHWLGWSNYRVANMANIGLNVTAGLGLGYLLYENPLSTNLEIQQANITSMMYPTIFLSALLNYSKIRHTQQDEIDNTLSSELTRKANIENTKKMMGPGLAATGGLLTFLGFVGGPEITAAIITSVLSNMSTEYFLRNPFKPHKGKLAETLEGMISQAKQPLNTPLPSPQANYLPLTLSLSAASI